MNRFELVMKNSLGLEIARHPVMFSDGFGDDGVTHMPELLETISLDRELRQSLHVMQPGDTLELVDNEDGAS